MADLLHELDTEGFLASKDKDEQDKGEAAQDAPAITLWLVAGRTGAGATGHPEIPNSRPDTCRQVHPVHPPREAVELIESDALKPGHPS